MKIKLRFLALGLVALLGPLLASSQRISAYAAADRPSALPAAGASILATSNVPPDGSPAVPRSLAASTVYLPLVMRPPTSPGLWLSSNLAHEFYVTPDSAYVRNHAVYITVGGCGDYTITHTVSEPISSNHYSFTGAFYASGTFYSPTTATVTDGLSNLYISGCGFIIGGPWTNNYYWYNSSQPALAARVVREEIGTSVPPDHTVEVVKVR